MRLEEKINRLIYSLPFFPVQMLALARLPATFILPHADAPLLCFGRWRKGSFWHEALRSPISDSLIYSPPLRQITEEFCKKRLSRTE